MKSYYPFQFIEVDTEKLWEEIGENIKEVRKSKKITVEEVSKRTQIDTRYLYRIERGCPCSLKKLYVIAHSLGCKLEKLVDVEECIKYDI